MTLRARIKLWRKEEEGKSDVSRRKLENLDNGVISELVEKLERIKDSNFSFESQIRKSRFY